MAAQGNLPLIALEPAVELIRVSSREAAIGLVKTANQKLIAVGVGYPVAVLPGHLDTELLTGDRVATGAAVN